MVQVNIVMITPFYLLSITFLAITSTTTTTIITSSNAYTIPVVSSSISKTNRISNIKSIQLNNKIVLYNNAPRHDVTGSSNKETMVLSPIEQAKMDAYMYHQQNANKLDYATDIRTLIQYNHGFAVLSTFSKNEPLYPNGSVVGFAPDTNGQPIFIFSGMSSHTQDILNNPYCSLTIAAKDFKGAADGRVNLMGRIHLIKDADEKLKVQEIYKQKHPGAFWINFGDFNWFHMTVDKVRFVGGFARAGTCTAEEYIQSKPDPIAEFSPIMSKHMNDDHMESTIAMIHNNIPGMEYDTTNKITDAIITSIDSLGMYIKVTREKPVQYLPQQFKLRLPFPRQAMDRKDVKQLIIELSQNNNNNNNKSSVSSSSSSTAEETSSSEI